MERYGTCSDSNSAPSGPSDGAGLCSTSEANSPVTPAAPSLAQVQAVDTARRQLHEMGLRGYTVALVWRQRDAQQVWKEVRRIDLMPVRVQSVSEVNWTSSVSGMHADGGLVLTEISLAQVSDQDLLGRLSGDDPNPDIQFLYEVRRYPRCAGEEPVPQRYTPASLPEYDLENLQWVVFVSDAHNPVSGTDKLSLPKKTKLSM